MQVRINTHYDINQKVHFKFNGREFIGKITTVLIRIDNQSGTDYEYTLEMLNGNYHTLNESDIIRKADDQGL